MADTSCGRADKRRLRLHEHGCEKVLDAELVCESYLGDLIVFRSCQKNRGVATGLRRIDGALRAHAFAYTSEVAQTSIPASTNQNHQLHMFAQLHGETRGVVSWMCRQRYNTFYDWFPLNKTG